MEAYQSTRLKSTHPPIASVKANRYQLLFVSCLASSPSFHDSWLVGLRRVSSGGRSSSSSLLRVAASSGDCSFISSFMGSMPLLPRVKPFNLLSELRRELLFDSDSLRNWT